MGIHHRRRRDGYNDTDRVKCLGPSRPISGNFWAETPTVNEVTEPVVVTMRLDATDVESVGAVLARYVVSSRGHPGCRNIDLCGSVTIPGRFVVVEKWQSLDDQRRHFDSDDMVAMAEGCRGRLASPPEIDLLEPISAHDLS
jgi:quinol monooxygenase YgiN